MGGYTPWFPSAHVPSTHSPTPTPRTPQRKLTKPTTCPSVGVITSPPPLRHMSKFRFPSLHPDGPSYFSDGPSDTKVSFLRWSTRDEEDESPCPVRFQVHRDEPRNRSTQDAPLRSLHASPTPTQVRLPSRPDPRTGPTSSPVPSVGVPSAVLSPVVSHETLGAYALPRGN